MLLTVIRSIGLWLHQYVPIQALYFETIPLNLNFLV